MNLTLKKLEELYGDQVLCPKERTELYPRNSYGVYILTLDESAIVIGHGKYNRARVIFDDEANLTKNHIKAILVRLYHLFGEGHFERYYIRCSNKEHAKGIESELHGKFGGNSRQLPAVITEHLFKGIDHGSTAEMLLRIALISSYDGLTDLRLWRREGIISNEDWEIIAQKLKLFSIKS